MSGEARPLADDAVVRSRWDDALERDGEMLVLAGNDVSLLSPLAAEAALAARRGLTVAALATHLEREFGAPPDRDRGEAVREVIAALMSRGVMTVEASP